MAEMMMSKRDAMTPRRGRRRTLVLSSALLGALALTSEQALGQAAAGSSRDTLDRTFRLQLRTGETTYVRIVGANREQLAIRLDSLQRRFEDLEADAPERPKLERQIEALIRALDHLERAGRIARVSAEMDAQIQNEIARALAKSADAARMASFVSVGAMPRGWIGINVEAPQTVEVRGDSAYIRYFSYPQVVSVELGSPAEKVGIARGDRLVAYNGADVRDKPVNVTRLLQPSRRVTVTVLRDGVSRDFPVVVANAPIRLVQRMRAGGRVASNDEGVSVFSLPRRAALTEESHAVHFERMTETAPLAGASLAAIRSPTLGQYFGVSSGILVTSVFGDPAVSSGLQEGDVIVRANGRALTSVLELRRLVDAVAADRSIELTLVRHQKPLTLKLRW